MLPRFLANIKHETLDYTARKERVLTGPPPGTCQAKAMTGGCSAGWVGAGVSARIHRYPWRCLRTQAPRNEAT